MFSCPIVLLTDTEMYVTITHRSEGSRHKRLRSGYKNPDLPVGFFVSGGVLGKRGGTPPNRMK